MDSAPLISVVVCTYNRAAHLGNVLGDLAGQTMEEDRHEVIVVDNNSTDCTRQVAEKFCAQRRNFRYFHEPQQGLSHARNRGWREARGQYVAYTDDDCRIPAQWLNVAEDVIQTHVPAIFGGPYYACYDTAKPVWFQDRYGSHVPAALPRVMGVNEYLDGGNLFVRRTVVEKLGGFDTTLGMKGSQVDYGEETKLQMRLRKQLPAATVYCDDRLYLYHTVAPRKWKLTARVYACFRNGRCWSRLVAAGEGRQVSSCMWLRQFAGTVYAVVKNLGWDIWVRDRRMYPSRRGFVYERTCEHVLQLGVVWEELCMALRAGRRE